eukprot:gene69428-biopygen32312
MTIRSGKSYGNTKAVSAKFTIADSDFATLYNAAATTQLDLKLSVNSLISPAVSGEVSVLKGSELGSADWFNPAVFPDPIVLYSAPTTIVINNLVAGNFLNLAEVQLFGNGVQIPTSMLTFTLSSEHEK